MGSAQREHRLSRSGPEQASSSSSSLEVDGERGSAGPGQNLYPRMGPTRQGRGPFNTIGQNQHSSEGNGVTVTTHPGSKAARVSHDLPLDMNRPSSPQPGLPGLIEPVGAQGLWFGADDDAVLLRSQRRPEPVLPESESTFVV